VSALVRRVQAPAPAAEALPVAAQRVMEPPSERLAESPQAELAVRPVLMAIAPPRV
jgi:hypothetical protein